MEKKVYKANKKAIIGILLIAFIVFFCGFLIKPIMGGIKNWYLNMWIWHDIPSYNFKIKLPRAYEDAKLKENSESGILSSTFLTDTNITMNEEYVSKSPERVYYGKNSLNGISMMIQCLYTPRTDRTLEDIADSQHVLIRIHYEDDYQISSPRREYANVLDTLGVRTATDLTNDKGTITIINYLVPMEDKEVTISFYGEKETVDKYEEEIEKIVSEMKNK